MKSKTHIFVLKALVVIILICFLVFKIVSASILESLSEIQLVNYSIIGIVVLLMVLNWSLETKKWQVLLEDLEPISFSKSFKSVLSGLSSGLLTPNRVGNFIGRLAFVKKKNHNQATINTLVGNLAQFISTILLGVIGVIALLSFKLQVENSLLLLIFSAVVSNLGCYVYFKPKALNFYPLNIVFSSKTKYSINQINDTKVTIKIKVLFISLLRYTVFCIQYFLLFKAFGLDIPSLMLLSLIATVFLITTIIPSLLFGKLFVRESAAVFVFSLANIDVSIILIVAFLLWLINLAIPAIVGSVFWLKQKNYV